MFPWHLNRDVVEVLSSIWVGTCMFFVNGLQVAPDGSHINCTLPSYAEVCAHQGLECDSLSLGYQAITIINPDVISPVAFARAAGGLTDCKWCCDFL